jgi:hypothetical protein
MSIAHNIRSEFEAFRVKKLGETGDARQMAALQLACGIDFGDLLNAEGETRRKLIEKLTRAIERERLRGANRHWSYDLNRHIALKQALDRLLGEDDLPRRRKPPSTKRKGRRKTPFKK